MVWRKIVGSRELAKCGPTSKEMFLVFYDNQMKMAYLERTKLGYEEENTIGSYSLLNRPDDSEEDYWLKHNLSDFVRGNVMSKIAQWKLGSEMEPTAELNVLQAEIVAVEDLKDDGEWCVRKAVTVCFYAEVTSSNDDYDGVTDMLFYIKFYVTKELRDLSLYIDATYFDEEDYKCLNRDIYGELYVQLFALLGQFKPTKTTVGYSDKYGGKTDTYFIDFTDDLF